MKMRNWHFGESADPRNAIMEAIDHAERSNGVAGADAGGFSIGKEVVSIGQRKIIRIESTEANAIEREWSEKIRAYIFT